MGDDNTDIGTLFQRTYTPPTPLILVNGRLNFPVGSVINMLGSTLILEGQFLDALYNQNIIQGATLPNPNTVDTTTTRSIIVASENSDMVGGDLSGIISCTNANVNATGTGVFEASFMAADNNSNITHTSTGNNNLSAIIGSDTANITNSGGSVMTSNTSVGSGSATISATNGTLARAGIYSSDVSSIIQTGNSLTRNTAIVSSETCTISSSDVGTNANHTIIGSSTSTIVDDSTGGTARCLIAGSTSSNILAPVGAANSHQNDALIACNTTSINGPFRASNCVQEGSTNISMNATSGELVRCFVLGSNLATIACNSTAPIVESGIIGSSFNTDITTSGTNNFQRGVIVGGSQNKIRATNSPAFQNVIAGSSVCLIDGGSNNFIGGSLNTTFTSNAVGGVNTSAFLGSTGILDASTGSMFRVAAVGTLNATVTGPCQQVTVVGNTPTVSGFSNVFCCSATATQTNQAIFGTRLDVTGNNNNISVLGGYINALRSLVTPNTQTGTNFTLTLNNSYIRFTANSNVLTLPTLASIQALLPVGTGRTWFVSSTSLFASTNASSIVTTGGDVFNGITGLTSYFLEPNGTEVTLRSGSSGWLIQPFKQSALYSTGVANNIGVTPPLANASLLPTSTNQTTHEALGASSYCKMATRSANNTTLFGFGASNIGFTINSGGGYGDFEYTIVVVHTTAVAGTPYLLRFDVQDSVTGVTVPGSFSAFRGSNDISGSCTFNWRFTGYKTNLATYRLRISQSATFPITAAGSITFASIRAVQSF